jgi:hypothetical protein
VKSGKRISVLFFFFRLLLRANGILILSAATRKEVPMINKDKTIAKAVSKYHSILPVMGRRSIDDCFICVRGEYFFLFKTKDKIKHIIKAEIAQPDLAPLYFNRDFFYTIIKTLNKPIVVPPLLLKNIDLTIPVILTRQINREFLLSIYKSLNKPIFVR